MVLFEVVGLFLFIFLGAGIWYAIASARQDKADLAALRECPYCRQNVRRDASVCPVCHSVLYYAAPPPPPPPPPS
jgi:uncharacterized paraquat-inducible protein A